MHKHIIAGLAFVLLSLGCTVAEAGVVRHGYKGSKKVVKVSARVVKVASKVVYKVAY